jgi:hypothetical protein
MTNDHLITFLETLKTDVINSLQANGKYATGQTAKEITVVEDGNNLQLQLPGYVQELETGRGPTSKNAAPGTPPMIQRIQQWCRAKGIPDKAAWAIKKAIDKNGYKGVPGIITEPLSNENIDMRLSPLMNNIADEVIEEITKQLSINN